MKEIIIIGAGAAGIGAALELADRGYKVRLLEKNNLGSGASGRNPGRMGLGFHYTDFDTAKMYLRASIQVQRKFSNFLVADHLDKNHPFRRGRYFITKNSDNSPEEILATYQKLKEEYITLIEEDPRNQVFGPPENFYRILTPSEYQNDVNMDVVAVGVETSEHLFNWGAFSQYIKEVISNHPNITFNEHTEVEHIEHNQNEDSRFILHIKQQTDKMSVQSKLKTDYIINSTWENIEKLNAQVGIQMVPNSRTNRLKCLLIVKLPESLINSNSMFFCMGQHGMYSNLGNGYGMITYAKITNMETSTELDLSENTQRLLRNEATDQEKEQIALEMLNGIAQYIPAMKEATWVDVRFGIVQTAGVTTLSDLLDPKSSFHKRDYDNVRVEQIGLTSNPCVKLFYFVRNGEKVANLLQSQIDTSLWIDGILQELADIISDPSVHTNQASTDEKKIIKNGAKGYLERYVTSMPSNPSAFRGTFFKTVTNKLNINEQIKEEIPLKKL